ncbi:basic form of pathogenesis-related protein 1-like [Ipomoea triloba]|uniref:basic form of pathogenesis-related protein 1-like n=1 Tax=Ipomoea triloba TaxID=35885 RepID=UPI00125E3A53|nr:basic form of pathogenesis-related protein 1-like [Ipomoea triloba]
MEANQTMEPLAMELWRFVEFVGDEKLAVGRKIGIWEYGKWEILNKQVGAPPVKWNTTLADFAESYATKRSADCAAQHSQGSYGENIAMASAELSPADSVKLWMDEKKYYDQASNSCTGGECHHYTQVVWRDTTSIGCARATCKTGWMFVTCNYYPPGNYVGERPY